MIIFVMTLLFLAAVFLLFWQISNIISIIFGSPYVIANKNIVAKTLQLAVIKPGQIFFDLGCGNGQTLIEAQKLGLKAVGFEISPIYFLWAKLRTLPYKNIEVRFQDIRKVNLSKADVVYVYLLPEFLNKLTPKFKKELRNKTKIISVGFKIPGFQNRLIKINKRRVYIAIIN